MRSYSRNTVCLRKIPNPFYTQPERISIFLFVCFLRIACNAKYHIETVMEVEICEGRKTVMFEKYKTCKGSILNLHCKLNYANQNYP